MENYRLSISVNFQLATSTSQRDAVADTGWSFSQDARSLRFPPECVETNALGVGGWELGVSYRCSSGRKVCGYGGPRYSVRGRISRLLLYCSRQCAVQPEIRLTAKIGV